MLAVITQGFLKKLRVKMFNHMQTLPIKYFDVNGHGDIMSYYTNDIDTLGMNLNQSVTQIITAICTLVGILIMMLSISWQMTLISIIVMPIGAFLVKINNFEVSELLDSNGSFDTTVSSTSNASSGRYFNNFLIFYKIFVLINI